MTRTREQAESFLRKLYAQRFGGDGCAPSCGGSFVLASAPGRVEIAGNHTDHQGGRTISAAIDQRTYGLAAPNGSDEIRVFMDGFGEAVVHVADLDARPNEEGTSISLVRGMAACAPSGSALRGFDMATFSDVPAGCGLSSSAAFEMLLGTAIHAMCDPAVKTVPQNPTELALAGVQAERVYFGKPCGAQDQLASAHGGVCALDFSAAVPRIDRLALDLDAQGYALCLVDSRCDHTRYPDEFAAIPAEMHAVARHFDCDVLESVPYPAFLAQLPRVRTLLGDRAALRALHYFEETRRVQAQRRALETGDFEAFLDLVRASGASSAQFLQNVSPSSENAGADQPVMVILALCAHLLDGVYPPSDEPTAPRAQRGAFRVHGGGFGGGVLAIVPRRDADAFTMSMNGFLGYDACMPLSLSSLGAHAERLA